MAAADRISLGGAESRLKMEIEATAAPARSIPDGTRTSGPLVAEPSSGTTRNRSCDIVITGGRSTKRPRRTPQVEPLFDVAARDRMFEKEGADVELKLDVFSPSRPRED